MQLLIQLFVIFCVLFVGYSEVACNQIYLQNDANFDEFRHVSQLRVSLRTVERPQQCLLFWKGFSEKLEEETSYRRPDSGMVDQELLKGLVLRLKAKTVYKKLGTFVDECLQVLSRLPREVYAQFARKGRRALDDNQVDVISLKRRIAQLEEQLRQTERERDAALEKIRRLKDENPEDAIQWKLFKARNAQI